MDKLTKFKPGDIVKLIDVGGLHNILTELKGQKAKVIYVSFN